MSFFGDDSSVEYEYPEHMGKKNIRILTEYSDMYDPNDDNTVVGKVRN